jgi:uncharacterized Zn finger protein (UPF0148 family)
MADQFTCVNCGLPLVDYRCKVICPRCGLQEDCSDAGLIDYERTNARPKRDPRADQNTKRGTAADRPYGEGRTSLH